MTTEDEVLRLREELRRAGEQRDVFARELGKTLHRFEEKVRELSVIRGIGEALKYSLDVRKVFEVILDTIVADTNAENCSLMLLDRDAGVLRVKAARGQNQPVSRFFQATAGNGRVFRLGEGIAGWVAQHGEPVYIPDISNGQAVRLYPELDAVGSPVLPSDFPRPPQFVLQTSSPHAIGSILCLPLIIDKEVVGVVNLSHPHADAFSPVDQRVMTIITDQVAIALNNVQVFDDMQHLNRMLEDEVGRATEGLQRMNRELQAEVCEREKAEQALKVRTRQLGAVTDATLVFLRDGNWRRAAGALTGGALELTGSQWGFVGVVVEGRTLRLFPREGGDLEAPSSPECLELTEFENPFGRVIVNGAPLVADDLSSGANADSLPPGIPTLAHFMGVPILRGEEAIGLIGVANRPGGYTNTERDRLEMLAQAAGILYDSYRREEHEAALERQLFQAQKMEAVGTLAGGIAHDFNNLLTTVIGFAELALLEPDQSTRWRDYVSKLPQSAQRAAKLIAQLLNFSRHGAPERHPLQLVHLVKETLKIMERTLPETITIHATVRGEVPPVLADPTQMQQVILNLCINASHAMPAGGDLTVGLQNVTHDGISEEDGTGLRPGTYACLSVRDTGMGMTPEVQRRIFEPFFTTKEAGKGTGLGLAMVQEIVKAHRGKVLVTSVVGKGSEFRVYLPTVPSESSPSPPMAEVPCGGSETILFVEDKQEVLDLGQSMLERLGYRVLTATDGEDALRVYVSHRPEIDLVVTDVVMPRMGGEALHEAMKGIDPEVRVVMVSGYAPGQDYNAMREAGVRGFIQKPFDLVRLGRAVRKALEDEGVPCLRAPS